MSRNGAGSRLQPVIYQPPAPLFRRRGQPVRRGRAAARVPNPLHAALKLYAFVAALDGPAGGPWLTSFECVRADWFEAVVGTNGPLEAANYGITRLRTVMAGGTYEAAWEASVANRVVLRHAYEAYSEQLARTDGQWRLGTYRVVIDEEDRINGPAAAPLVPGKWYGLELLPLLPGDGVWLREDPATGVLGNEASCPFLQIWSLRENSGAPPFYWPAFHSQATLRALNFLRGG